MTFILIVYLKHIFSKSFNTHETSNNISNHENGL